MTNLIIFIITTVVLTLVANSAKNSAGKKRSKPTSTEHHNDEKVESENPLQRMLKTLEKELMMEQNPAPHQIEPAVTNDNLTIETLQPIEPIIGKTAYKPLVIETNFYNEDKNDKERVLVNKNSKTNQNDDIMNDFSLEKAVIFSAILKPKYLDL